MRQDMIFWPPTASTTSEVKNFHAHVITQDTCNKFIEIKFYVGCMVFLWLCLFRHQLPVKLKWNKTKMKSTNIESDIIKKRTGIEYHLFRFLQFQLSKHHYQVDLKFMKYSYRERPNKMYTVFVNHQKYLLFSTHTHNHRSWSHNTP